MRHPFYVVIQRVNKKFLRVLGIYGKKCIAYYYFKNQEHMQNVLATK